MWQESAIKKFFVLFLILLLRCAGGSCAGEDDRYRHLVKSTPYDQKNALMEVLNESYRSPERSPAESVGGLFRKARYFRYHKERYGDDWQSPQKTEKMQAGDCEDKAIWLYARLRAAGYEDIKLVVGKYRRSDAGHHVWLMYTEENGNVLILDPTIQNKAWPAASFGSGLYRPLFSFEGQRRYSYVPDTPFHL